ncbi:ferric reductase NAD binding domain-containing protein [Phakopsora pachyrhizi]|uniref:Ferric reductase NAD binding domain-domain-containing protein n=1 Tax=Phakopsora pachyrhizi TaxID=170000 RepID=A0AAV0BSN9_PHAPC|nr:ferric reductase NAD binding domain-containing protein [Phakopsora pachyrhizi]CAH7689255.1 ferric reductase NAD binding domain-domain-containing protein [Phakopsora pachyrhizi]
MAFSKASNNDMDFSDQPPLYPMPNSDGTNSFGPPISPSDLPSHLRKNLSEKARLQGLMAGNRSSFLSVSSEGYGGSTSRVDLSRGVIIESKGTRFKSWMVNEGGRKFFIWTWIFIHIFSYICAFLNFLLKDNLTQARATFNITYPVARSAALVLHIDVAFILLPVCRNFITLMRRSALNHVIPFEKNITFHKFTGFALAFFTAVHVAAHMVNFTELAIKTETGIIGFIGANFLTGPGATGWIMTVALGIMVWYAREVPRRARFERFWYSHHLFIVFFVGWQLHGMFCMIQPDRPEYCSYNQIGVFWKYWLAGGLIFLWERVLREIRSRHKTFVSKVIQHPSRVCEVQIKKEKTVTRAGQYIFLNCPEVSFWQWHPFTLTSAPEEDYISVHIRCVGDFTTEFAEALGCDFSKKEKSELSSQIVQPPTDRILPRVMVDGPFGSASEDVFKFEAVMLVGGGIGVTPFASVLKSIWYRLNASGGRKESTRLQKVYFFWVCRDFDSFEWFRSLLAAIEEQDLQGKVELHTYITQKLKDDVINNIIVSDVGGDLDAITRLRSPTHYGRPNWDRIFNSVREKHPATDVGVFFCGPGPLGHTLHLQCNKWTGGEEDDTRFFWGKLLLIRS